MGGWWATLLSALQGEDGTTIEQRLFRGLALLTGLLSIFIVIPLNAAQGLPGFINACVLVFGLGSLLLFGGTFRGYYGTKLLFFLHMASLDLIWFSNAGSQGSIAFYFFAAVLYLVTFFRGPTRWAMLGLYLCNGAALLGAEWLHPEWVHPFHSTEARLLDLLFGFILSSVVCVIILWVVLEAYHRERQRLQASLIAEGKSEARFQSLLMNAPLPILVATPQGRVDHVNHRFETVLGYTAADIPHATAWWERTYPDLVERKRAEARWREARRDAQAAGTAVPPMEYTVTCKDGRAAQLEVQAAVVGEQWLVMFTDVSERRRDAEALRQAQKLESLGVLAGGIAHDFNNLLSAMLGNLNLAQVKQTAGSAATPFLDNMEGTIRKAAELTRQMLAYSGKGRFIVEPVDLSRMVGEITHLLAVSISKKVKMAYELAQDLPAIEADAAQVQQIIMNLITNASEAIGEGEGVIRVGTALRQITAADLEGALLGQGLSVGRYVSLSVADTGCGMEAQVIERIFDPFFSTKGSGRGLGLSAMLGIMRGHQAGIEITSEPGQGSRFQIHFRASQAPLPVDALLSPASPRGRFQGKILLVDDEPELRFSYASMLQHLGFQVLAARDGIEALERFQRDSFTLVLMDLTMPRMDGKEAFLQMKAQNPDVKVVLVSGYSEGDAVETLRGLRPTAFLQKPFSLLALTRVLETVLEADPAQGP